MSTTAFAIRTLSEGCTRRPTVPSEPKISPAHLNAMEQRAEEFRKEKLLSRLCTRRPTVHSEPEISPARLNAMEQRAEAFRENHFSVVISPSVCIDTSTTYFENAMPKRREIILFKNVVSPSYWMVSKSASS